MDFKGTKGKWEISESSIGFVYALNDKKERNVFSLFINNDGKVSQEEIKANALLISKSRQMLEMLKELRNAILSEDYTRMLENSQLAKELIIEATEI